MLLTWLSPWFPSLTLLPTSKLGPSCADSQVGGLIYILRPCGSLQWTLLWGWEFFPPSQSSHVFSVTGFEALFPHPWTLHCLVCLAPQLILPVYLDLNVGPPSRPSATLPGLPATAFLRVLSAQLPVSAPPSSLDECFFFNSLVVGLPYSLTLYQFWLFFVSKFVVVLLLVV